MKFTAVQSAAVLWLALINILAFGSMANDKQRARRGVWRIPERTLFLLAILGGSIGAWLGMYVFHHKTKHWYFVMGIPLIFVLQLALVAVTFHAWSDKGIT